MDNIKVGLTQFIEFTLKQTMTAKMSKVQEIKNQDDYRPYKDHWKQLRDKIKFCCEYNRSLDELDSLLHVVHERKVNSYNEAIKSFKSFARKKELEWFDPPKLTWVSKDGLVVSANPELGLVIDGHPHIVKLFFKGKGNKMTQQNIKPILNLMLDSSSRELLPQECQVSVLNIKNGKLHSANSVNTKTLSALSFEARTFLDIWINSELF